MIQVRPRSASAFGRAGATLMEVLVAIFIMGIGVLAILSLFPIGILSMAQAVRDGRVAYTYLDAAQQASAERIYDALPPDSLYLMIDTVNDPAPGATDQNANVYTIHVDGAQPARLIGWDRGNGTNERPTGFNPVTDTANFRSFPVLIDPELYHEGPLELAADPANTTYPGYIQDNTGIQRTPPKRIPIPAALQALPSYPYQGLQVVTVERAHRFRPGWHPFNARPGPAADDGWRLGNQKSYTRRWFSSPMDVFFGAHTNPVLPDNPMLREPAGQNKDNYLRLGTAGAMQLNTAERTHPYSWAMMVRKMLVNNDSGGPRPATVSNSLSLATMEYKYLCFHKRRLANPYQVIEGCFFEGSNRVTLSWPVATARPTIRRGTWLCECSVTGGKVSGTYSGTYRNYRQAMNFYQIVEWEDPQIDPNNGRVYQMVNIDRPASNCEQRVYNTSNPDIRNPDTPYTNPGLQWPITGNPPPANTAVYYSVILFDGLEHVYP